MAGAFGREVERDAEPRADEHARQSELMTRRVLMYLVVPLWLGGGFLDYLQHRRTHIQHHGGTAESAMHSLMLIEAAPPALMGLFLQVNAGVLLASLGAVAVHTATAYLDVAFADGRRRIHPSEQHAHAFLEVMPAMATGLLAALHSHQARALLGRGEEPRYRPRLKQPPLPRRYTVPVLGAFVAFGIVPYAEELWRCWRAERGRRRAWWQPRWRRA
jgi:hypothetical protein